jgi:hypothetical protein
MCNGVQFGHACLAQLKKLYNFKYFGGPIGDEHVPSRWRFDDLILQVLNITHTMLECTYNC